MIKGLIVRGILFCYISIIFTISIEAEESINKEVLLETCVGCDIVNVSLNGLINEVVKRNYSLSSERMKVDISKHQVKVEEGIFEPKFNMSTSLGRTNVPNSAEQTISRGFQSEYKDRTREAEASISGLLVTGGDWKLSFSDRKNQSNLIAETQGFNAEYTNRIGLSFNQPLLRGMGMDVTSAKINIAKVSNQINEAEYKSKLMGLITTTIQLYWKLYGTQKLYESWHNTLLVSKKQLENIKLLANYGKVAKTEVLEAKSAIFQKKTELLSLKARMKEIQNQLMSLLNLSKVQNSKSLFVVKAGGTEEMTLVPNIETTFDKAIENLPELKLAELRLKTEKLKYAYNKNQLLPDLKLQSNVYTMGLEQTHNNSLYCSLGCEKHTSWSVGLMLEVPLYGNDQAQENLSISKLKLNNATDEIKALQSDIYNLLSTKIEQLKIEQEKFHAYTEEVGMKETLLDVERQKLQLGRAKMRDVLEYEDKLMNAERKLFSSLVNWKVAEALLNKATGDLLNKQNIEVDFDSKQEEYQNQHSVKNITFLEGRE